jgi:hypothetical protein
VLLFLPLSFFLLRNIRNKKKIFFPGGPGGHLPSPAIAAKSKIREVDLFGPDAHENATPKAVKVSAATKSQNRQKKYKFLLLVRLI